MRQRRRARGAVVAACVGVAAMVLPAPAPAGAATPDLSTYITMISESGDYIGHGSERTYHPGNANISVTSNEDTTYTPGSAQTVNVQINGADGRHYWLNFDAPGAEELTAGTRYTDADDYPLNSDRAGINVSGDGRGCSGTGEFHILDIGQGVDGVVNRLALTYQYRCGPTADDATIYGEVHYNIPVDPGPPTVLPQVVDFPRRDLGVAGRQTPVVIRNDSPAPLELGQLALTGDDPTSYTIPVDPCSQTTLAVGSSCTARVVFKPDAEGLRTAQLTIPAGGAARVVQLRGRGIGGITKVVLYSEGGDPVGQGQYYEYTLDDAKIGAGGVAGGIVAGVSGITDPMWWSMYLYPANGDRIAPGTYEGAERHGGAVPGLDVSGHSGCNQVSGSFTIHEAAFSPVTGNLERLSATFEQHCNHHPPALYGSVAWRASSEPQPLPLPPGEHVREDRTPPSPVQDLEVRGFSGRAALTWDNPGTDYSRTVVRMGEGLHSPTSMFGGTGVYDGSGTAADIYGLSTQKTYSFSVFAVDAAGNPSEVRTVVLRPARVNWSLEPDTITFGQTSRLTATVKTGELGEDYERVPRAEVRVVVQLPDQPSEEVATLITNAEGKVTMLLQPRRNAEVSLFVDSGRSLWSVASEKRKLRVRPAIAATADDVRITRGETVAITSKVRPAHVGHNVALQRRTDTGWRSVEWRTLDASSRASWEVRPGAVGAKRYRVFSPSDTDHAPGFSNRVLVDVHR